VGIADTGFRKTKEKRACAAPGGNRLGINLGGDIGGVEETGMGILVLVKGFKRRKRGKVAARKKSGKVNCNPWLKRGERTLSVRIRNL